MPAVFTEVRTYCELCFCWISNAMIMVFWGIINASIIAVFLLVKTVHCMILSFSKISSLAGYCVVAQVVFRSLEKFYILLQS